MNSDSEEKAVRVVIQSSGCTHQHQHWLRRMEPCWRGFLLHHVLLGAAPHTTHYVGGACVCAVFLSVDRCACDILCLNFSSFRSEGRLIYHCILHCVPPVLLWQEICWTTSLFFSANRAHTPGVFGSLRWWNEWRANEKYLVLRNCIYAERGLNFHRHVHQYKVKTTKHLHCLICCTETRTLTLTIRSMAVKLFFL